MTTQKKDKIIIGKPSSQMKNSRWYQRGDENISGVDKLTRYMKGSKPVSYFKVVYASRGGVRNVEQFWKTNDNGYMTCVDTSICKINIVLGLPSVRMIVNSNKREYQKAFNKVLKVLS